MLITPIKTDKVTPSTKLFDFLDKNLVKIQNQQILAVTSKIIAITQGRIHPFEKDKKQDLIKKEADFFIPTEDNIYNITLTIKNGVLAVSAGIDESNGNGYFVLWPNNPQKMANQIRNYLTNKFSLTKVGVVITDSKSSPLRRGITGVCITHSGFQALNSYIGKPDLFGRELHTTQVNVADAIATSAVLVMGEGSEQTPIALVSDISFVQFQDHDPTNEELDNLKINLENDLYSPILKNAPWQKGKS